MVGMGLISLIWGCVSKTPKGVISNVNIIEGRLMDITISFVFDIMRIIFSGVVGWIGASVFIISFWYMSADKNWSSRFATILFRFVVSIWILIFASNIVFMLVGWDGLGISSFILVIYYINKEVLGSGLVTAFINRLGDAILIVSIMVVCYQRDFLGMSRHLQLSTMIKICSGLFIVGSITKRAQVPFSRWLPEAIAAPTPVSTLVHSSTLVTAGVYIMLRYNFILTPSRRYVLIWISCLTLLVAGSSAVVETDVKKITALSTLSQVSLMVFCVGIHAYDVSFFHLCTHAFVKASLFIAVACIIYYSRGCQDMRMVGSVWLSLPERTTIYLMMNLSLMGIPCSAVYQSKHLLLRSCISSQRPFYLSLFAVFSIFLTFAYSVRRCIWIVRNSVEGKELSGLGSSQVWWMRGLIMLSLLSLIFGFIHINGRMSLNYSSKISVNAFYHGRLVFITMCACNILLIAFYITNLKNKGQEVLSSIWNLKNIIGNRVGGSTLLLAERVNQIIERSYVLKKFWTDTFRTPYSYASGIGRTASYASIPFLLLSCIVFICLYGWFL